MSPFLSAHRHHRLFLGPAPAAELPVTLLTDCLGAGENAHGLMLVLACRLNLARRSLWWRPQRARCIPAAYFTLISFLLRREEHFLGR